MTPEAHRAALIEYLHAKIAIDDWHGVSDVANDLRVLEAQHPFLRWPVSASNSATMMSDERPTCCKPQLGPVTFYDR